MFRSTISLKDKKIAAKRKYPDIDVDEDGNVLCSVCVKGLVFTNKHGEDTIKKHMETAVHKKKKNESSTSRQPLLKNIVDKSSQALQGREKFFFELTEAFIAANIPLFKLNHPVLKKFLEKEMKKTIPHRTTLEHNYIDKVYDATISTIKSTIGDFPVYLIVDETQDVEQRFVLNILVGKLDGTYTPPMLLCTKFLEKANADTVSREVLDACIFLWDGKVKYDRLWLLLSDQAPYMVKSVKNLKKHFKNLHHVTCLAHALNLVCEAIRSKYEDLDRYISNMKKVFKKSNYRKKLFQEETGLPLPPEPVLTRWGTWICAALYHRENFAEVKNFMVNLDENSLAISRVKTLLETKDIEDQLIAIDSFSFLPQWIKKFESQGLSVEEQVQLIEEVEETLEDFAKEKLKSSLKKNPDYKKFVTNMGYEHRRLTKYAPLTTVDVERSFSRYKAILTDQRRRLTQENLEKLNVIHFNSNVFHSD